MKTGVEELVQEYDSGRLSRRSFVASLSALMLAPAATARAQSSAIEVSTLNHVSLLVSDVQRSTEFYQNVLGMPIQTYQGQGSVPSLRVGSGPQFVALAQVPNRAPGYIHCCFGIEGFNHERVMDTLADHGVEGHIRMRENEVPELTFNDPDGIELQLQDVSYCGGSGVLGNLCDPRDRPPRQR
jgi:catechol 2,3-dioxygenase-like lactoylglutathione lyase family enzyme